MLLALFLQLVLCASASYARGSYGDYRDYVFEDLGRKSTDNYYSEFENLGKKLNLGKKISDGVKAFADIKICGVLCKFDPSETQEQVHLIESLLCPFIAISGLTEYCPIFHFPPSVRHRRDISTFLDNLMV